MAPVSAPNFPPQFTPVFLPDLRLNASVQGPLSGAPLVLIHGQGGHAGLWDDLVALLPRHRILRFDLRGHGHSDQPASPYSMGALIRDAERLIEHFALKEAVVLGHGLGGLIAQGLAVKRLDLVRGLILSNTAAKIGAPMLWARSIEAVGEKGLSPLHDETMARWMGRNWKQNPALAQLSASFQSLGEQGWLGTAHAMKGSDFYETTATLRLPALFIAAGNDGITPADLMQESADLIPGHRFEVIRNAGHWPMVEQPQDYARVVSDFLTAIGHF